jgi:ACR3 family arsenite efflux pump ArsB
VLANVRYHETRRVIGDKRLLVASLVLNSIVGPALMFTLVWLLLPIHAAAHPHRAGGLSLSPGRNWTRCRC